MCFFLKILWFFSTLPVLLQRWCSTCLVCVHTLTPRENRLRQESGIYFKIFGKNIIFNEHPVSVVKKSSRKKLHCPFNYPFFHRRCSCMTFIIYIRIRMIELTWMCLNGIYMFWYRLIRIRLCLNYAYNHLRQNIKPASETQVVAIVSMNTYYLRIVSINRIRIWKIIVFAHCRNSKKKNYYCSWIVTSNQNFD